MWGRGLPEHRPSGATGQEGSRRPPGLGAGSAACRHSLASVCAPSSFTCAHCILSLTVANRGDGKRSDPCGQFLTRIGASKETAKEKKRQSLT